MQNVGSMQRNMYSPVVYTATLQSPHEFSLVVARLKLVQPARAIVIAVTHATRVGNVSSKLVGSKLEVHCAREYTQETRQTRKQVRGRASGPWATIQC